MTTQLKTKLAKRMESEFVKGDQYNLDADMANLLATGIDNGVMKVGQARMMAQLAADWGDAALLDAAESSRVLLASVSNKHEGYVSAEDNVLLNDMREKVAEESGALPVTADNPLVADMVDQIKDGLI